MGFGVMRSRGRKGQSADLIAFKDNVVYFCELYGTRFLGRKQHQSEM